MISKQVNTHTRVKPSRQYNGLVISEHHLAESLVASIVECLGEQNITLTLEPKPLSQLVALSDHTYLDFIFVEPSLIHNDITLQQIAQHYNCIVLVVNFNSNAKHSSLERLEDEFDVIDWPMPAAQLTQLITISLKQQSLISQHQQEKQLLTNTISCIGDILIYLDDKGDITEINQTAADLFAITADHAKGQPWYHLVKTRQDMSNKQSQQFIATAVKIKTVTKIHPLAILTSGKSSLLVDGVISPITYPNGTFGVVLMLRKLTSLDSLPTAQLPSNKLAAKDGANNAVSGILLLSPDHFNQINLRYGHDYGDKVLYAIAEVIRKFVRPTDLTSHYGGTMFMVMFADSSSEQIKNIVNKLHQKLQQELFLDTSIPMKFSFGFSVSSDQLNYSPVELFYFANFSLSQARELGGQQVRQWQQLNTMLQIGNLDRLSGNVSKSADLDYQKMLMQWSILNYLDNIEQPKLFFKELLTQLANGFDLNLAAVFTFANSELTLLLGQNAQGRKLSSNECTLSPNQLEYIKSYQYHQDENNLFSSVLANNGMEVIVAINSRSQAPYFIKLASASDMAIQSRDHHALLNIADYIGIKIDKFALNSHKSNNDTVSSHNGLDFWYRSSEMQTLMAEVAMVAPTNATVLITGESGTGKEMLAQSIHQASTRKDKPLVIFDCGAVVESLVESELFGHQKGSFTGADKNTIGRVQEADGGTLFLDEIGEMPIEVQVKLLRFVQEKQYSAVGSGKFKKVDVRLIAATNVDLKQRIKQGKFREDLYFRLNVFNIENIPLRNRKADIELIADSYLQVYANEYNKIINTFTPSALQALNEYQWPGNIRELKNLIHRAVILCSDSVLDCQQLGLYPVDNQTSMLSPNTANTANLRASAVLANSDLEQSFTQRGQYSGNINDDVRVNVAVDGRDDVEQLFKQTIAFVECYINITGNINRYDAIAPLVEFYLYKQCLFTHQQVALQAANQLNIAESTFRRRWKKLQQVIHPDNQMLTNKAEELAQYIININSFDSKVLVMHNFVARAALEKGFTNKVTSTLLGMSAPTLRRIIAVELQ
ncbi:sigma 54-interacting transcriptional regulator [Colwelliaceae bacterium BS250]